MNNATATHQQTVAADIQHGDWPGREAEISNISERNGQAGATTIYSDIYIARFIDLCRFD